MRATERRGGGGDGGDNAVAVTLLLLLLPDAPPRPKLPARETTLRAATLPFALSLSLFLSSLATLQSLICSLYLSLVDDGGGAEGMTADQRVAVNIA